MSISSNHKILLISNANCDFGEIGFNLYSAFRENGYDIDYLSKYPLSNHPEVKFVYSKNNKWHKYTTNIIGKLYRKIKKPLTKYLFFNHSDKNLPVNSGKIFKKLKKEYDIVIVYFWQNFLTPKTIESIYDRFNCKIFFYMADYAPMSGGCHYFYECDRYKIGCGKCPAWRSLNENDLTKKNVIIRQKIYDKINPIITGNSHMKKIYENSFLLRNRRFMKTLGILDLDHFKKLNKNKLKEKYQIPLNKEKILFFGCQSLKTPVKGMHLLIEALKKYHDNISEEERTKTLLIIAGKNIDEISADLPFDYKYLGFIKYKFLPEIYSLASCFLSPSINDAGPSMVNQSLACGTPVVAFEIGVALDCVISGRTGYRAKLGDVNDFYFGIKSITGLNPKQSSIMSDNCRRLAEKSFSKEETIRNYVSFFD